MTTGRSDGLILCDDLIFASKIAATARAHSLTVKVAKTVVDFERLFDELKPAGVILELDHSSFDIEALLGKLSPKPRVIAYGSHVDFERLKAARRAGCDVVLPRSAFVERLESEIQEWLSE